MEGVTFETEAGVRKPARATDMSAGYDVFLPEKLTLAPGEKRMVSTGIRVRACSGSRRQVVGPVTLCVIPTLMALLHGVFSPGSMLLVCLLVAYASYLESGRCRCRHAKPFVAVKEKSAVATQLGIRVFRGLVDCDYPDAVKIRVTNESDETVELEEEKAVCQFVIVPFLITEDDESPSRTRIGGFGSTGM